MLLQIREIERSRASSLARVVIVFGEVGKLVLVGSVILARGNKGFEVCPN